VSPTVPLSLFKEPDDEEGSSSPEPTEESEFELPDTAAMTHSDLHEELRAQLEDRPSPPDAADDGRAPTSSDAMPRASPTVSPVQHGGSGPKVLPRLKPCPFCGQKLVEKSDQDDKWHGHRDEAVDCWAANARIHDEEDAKRWNTRPQQARPSPIWPPPATRNGLEPKQELFVTEYMKDRNATQAAIRAGYNRKTARQMGAENLSKPVVRNEINRRVEEYTRTAGIDRVEILSAMWRAWKTDIRGLFKPNGGIKSPKDWPRELLLLVERYNAGSPTAAAKITISSKIKLGFDLLEATAQIPEKKVKVEHTPRAEIDTDAIVAKLRAKSREVNGLPPVIDVPPE
jgi:hypothetical protein